MLVYQINCNLKYAARHIQPSSNMSSACNAWYSDYQWGWDKVAACSGLFERITGVGLSSIQTVTHQSQTTLLTMFDERNCCNASFHLIQPFLGSHLGIPLGSTATCRPWAFRKRAGWHQGLHGSSHQFLFLIWPWRFSPDVALFFTSTSVCVGLLAGAKSEHFWELGLVWI